MWIIRNSELFSSEFRENLKKRFFATATNEGIMTSQNRPSTKYYGVEMTLLLYCRLVCDKFRMKYYSLNAHSHVTDKLFNMSLS